MYKKNAKMNLNKFYCFELTVIVEACRKSIHARAASKRLLRYNIACSAA